MGINVCDVNVIGSQLSLNFCSRSAARPNFEASHIISVYNFGSKNFKDAQLLMVDFNSSNLRSYILIKPQTVSFKINSQSSFILSDKFGINFEM